MSGPSLFPALLAGFTLFTGGVQIHGQTHVVTMPEASIGSGATEVFPLLWRFHPGDGAAFASPEFDDSGWLQEDTRLRPGETPETWAGEGWFRLWFMASDDWLDQPLAWTLNGRGAAEVFLDGRLLFSLGRIGEGEIEPSFQRVPYILSFAEQGPHLVAVRYLNPSWRRYHQSGDWAGFALLSRKANRATPALIESVRFLAGTGMFFVGVFASIALLHLALFAFHPASRENLYFAAYLGTIGALTYVMFQRELTDDPEFLFLYVGAVQGAGGSLSLLLGLLCLYQVFHPELPRRLVWIGSGLAAYGVMLWFVPAWGRWFPYVALLVAAEMIRVVTAAIFQRSSGAWLVGLGMGGLAVSFGWLMLVELEWIPAGNFTQLLPYGGALFLALCVSLYLARNFARTQRQLRLQLERVEALSKKTLEQEREAHRRRLQEQQREAEYRRKTQELEDARRLQMSLLPDRLPEHPQWELAARMITATEVGGDYYDVLDDGRSLTLAVGDATGHGLKAGMMVTAAKSLFNTMAPEEDLAGFLRRASAALKGMHLRRLYMSLLVARFGDGSIEFAGAGMPAVLVARAASGGVEEVSFRTPPLGSFPAFRYQVNSLSLGPGDTLLMMTDGFPELFNPQGEMLGYRRAAELFGRLAGPPAAELLDRLLSQADSWADGKANDDDMTFVVARMKEATA